MVADGIFAQIIAQGFGGLLTNLATQYLQKKDRRIKNDSESFKTDLTNHFELTFNKCMNVKTILNGDVTSKTLEIYVDQNFRIRTDTFDQYSMIDFIRSGNSVIILGEGGGGKSMFMRYLWLSYFEKSDGKIPFYLELRNLNSLTHSNISDFIFHSIIKSGSSIRQNDFVDALREGEIILFLDGFDEINYDQRDRFQKLILDLKEQNPKLTIILTSRSDERFIGWDNFEQAHVKSLDKDSSKSLIERADYNVELKKKFLAKFDALHAQHKDFLSNPLLAYMMLVTFSYNPDIPHRMFQFYEQSFEALYHRHDLSKGYKRKFHCDLDKYDFIRLTSYLCLKTYYDERIEFSKLELMEAIEVVKKIEGAEVSLDAFINDLVQSVCVLKIEGLTYTFTHRSFQEYFAAYCISRVATRNIDQLFANFSKRYSDKVLPMVSDINPELFREKFLMPNRDRFKDFFDMVDLSNIYSVFAEKTGAAFTIIADRKGEKSSRKAKSIPHQKSEENYRIMLENSGPMADFFLAAQSVSSQPVYSSNDAKNIEKDHAFVREVRKVLKVDSFELAISWSDGSMRIERKSLNATSEVTGEEFTKIQSLFNDAMMRDFLEKRATLLFQYVNGEAKRFRSVSQAFDSLF